MRETLKRIGRAAAFLLLGVVGTGGVALVGLYLLQPVQEVIYNAFYLQVGPSESTETAILVHFLVAGLGGISVTMLVGDYLSDRLAHRAAFAKGIAAVLGLLLVFLVVALAGLAAFLTALIVLAAVSMAVPLLLRYRFDVRSGGVPAFVGGVPVLVLLLLLAGFGLGWGWGYVVTAQEVPASTVNGTAVADFDDAPDVRGDLFAAEHCETDTEDRRVCRLMLRGYEHETAAARVMARHGVRCPYQDAQAFGSGGSFIARYDGRYYRVSCSPHGD